MHDQLQKIPISSIQLNPNQPRKHFDTDELIQLSESIRSVGILHPPLVRPLLENGKFELISGERRLRAAQMIGLLEIPVYIRPLEPSIAAHSALIENIQRVDLNPIDIAHSLKKLIEQFSYTQESVAKKIGKKRSTVANYLRLLSLPESIQQNIATNLISMGHAKAILSLEQTDSQESLLQHILKNHLSVRESEKLARHANENKNPNKTKHAQDPHLSHLENTLREKFNTHVHITPAGLHKGRITIDYYSLDDLDHILNLLKVSDEL